MLKSQQDVCCVKFGSILLKPANLTQVEKQLATWTVFQAEVQPLLIVEGIVHLHNKVVVHAFLLAMLGFLSILTNIRLSSIVCSY